MGRGGSIDWPSIFAQAIKQGIRYAFIDQDETSIPVLESLKLNYQYLQSLKV
jgi:hypothetical protein